MLVRNRSYRCIHARLGSLQAACLRGEGSFFVPRTGFCNPTDILDLNKRSGPQWHAGDLGALQLLILAHMLGQQSEMPDRWLLEI
jgi:hypothetical protein